MRIVFLTLWAVGKFVRRFHVRRYNRMMRLMKRILVFVMLKRGLWRARLRLRTGKQLAEFFVQHSSQPTLLLFIKLVLSRVILIQKWFRRQYVRQRLLLAIMNLQWSSIEFVVLRSRPGEIEDPSLTEAKISDSILRGQTSDVVPVPFRLRCLKEQLKVSPANMITHGRS